MIIDECELFLKQPEHRAPTGAHPGCAECVRLVEQGRAALLTGDKSRLADVRVIQDRHETDEHTKREA
jgi:hypothetical protein